MKRALLDINVLVALLDLDHVHHGRARSWLQREANSGWASCPLTQNGCVRIMSQAKYPNPLPTAEVIDRLRDATATSYHEFWPDDLSILDRSIVNHVRIHGPKQVTDVYLLALAVEHAARFITIDAAVPLSAVVAATGGASRRDLILTYTGLLLCEARLGRAVGESVSSRPVPRGCALRESLIVKGKKRAFNSTPDDFARELIKLFDEFALYRRTWPSAYDDVELMP